MSRVSRAPSIKSDAVIQHNWRIVLDEGHLPLRMVCSTCDQRSVESEDMAVTQRWALEHSGRHPSHTDYREEITRFWVTELVGPA